MADTYYAVTGDVNDAYTTTLNGIANLNTVDTIVGHIFTLTDGVATHVDDVTVTVNDATECTIDVDLGGSPGGWLPTATPGKYKIEYEVTFLDGSVKTWSANKADLDTIVVRDEGDSA